MILEYACFRLRGTDISSGRGLFLHDAPYNKHISNLRRALTQGIRILGRTSKRTFHLLQDTADPSLVYYIGEWLGLASYAQFRASKDRKELLDCLELCNAYLQWQDFFEAEPLRRSHFQVALQRPLHRRYCMYRSGTVSIMRFNFKDDMASAAERDLQCFDMAIRKFSPWNTLLSGKCLLRLKNGALLPTNSAQCGTKPTNSLMLICGWDDEGVHGQFTQEQGSLILQRIRSACSEIDVRLASPINLT